jgi:hypothetical protein
MSKERTGKALHRWYIQQNRNKKLKVLCNKVIENKKSIRRIQLNPTVVQWVDETTTNNENNSSRDPSDLSDHHFRDLQLQNNGNRNNDNVDFDGKIIVNSNSVVTAKDNDRSQRSQRSRQSNEKENKEGQGQNKYSLYSTDQQFKESS